MKLISINTSPAKEVTYQGKVIATGIFKQPRTAKVFVDKDNLQGDGQGDLKHHGGEHKAVYGFSHHHYRYWQEILARPDLSNGAFGENLTINLLDETALCIGDQLSIGESILEISQPRVPCYKLGIALDNNKAPQLFTRRFATGMYFRVIQAGFICAEDEVTVTKRHPDSLSVQALFRSYFDRNYGDAAKSLNTALTIRELAPEWRDKVVKKLAQLQV